MADHAVRNFNSRSCTAPGLGVRKDLAQAVAWYELAAQLGHMLAQYNLAVMADKGEGCKSDPVKAWLGSKRRQNRECQRPRSRSATCIGPGAVSSKTRR